MSATNPYGVLGVTPGATLETARAAYRRLAAQTHPDVNPEAREVAERRMKEINAAYAAIRLAERRRRTRAATAPPAEHYDPWSGPPAPPPEPPAGDNPDPIAEERFRRRYMEPGESQAPLRWTPPVVVEARRPIMGKHHLIPGAAAFAGGGLAGLALESLASETSAVYALLFGPLALVAWAIAAYWYFHRGSASRPESRDL